MSEPDSKKEVLIPCLQTIVDLLNVESDKNFSTEIFFECLAQEKGKRGGRTLVGYRTHPIGVALLDAFDDDWAKNQKRESLELLGLLYSALEVWEFESTLSPQESTFEKAKFFLTDENGQSATIISNDLNIDKVRAKIAKEDSDDSFDYAKVKVENTDQWLIQELKKKGSVARDALFKRIFEKDSKAIQFIKDNEVFF